MEMMDSGYSSRTVEGSIACNNQEFGDPVHGQKKQCFCEANLEPKVKRCALEGGTCSCANGNVFLGLLSEEGSSDKLEFDDFLENEFVVKYNFTGDIMCDAGPHGFGSDPQKGKAKQCFCDDIEYEDRECIEEKLMFYQEQREITNI